MEQGSKIAFSGIGLIILGCIVFVLGLAWPTDFEIMVHEHNKAAEKLEQMHEPQ